MPGYRGTIGPQWLVERIPALKIPTSLSIAATFIIVSLNTQLVTGCCWKYRQRYPLLPCNCHIIPRHSIVKMQAGTTCGASSQADLIQNYFLIARMLRFLYYSRQKVPYFNILRQKVTYFNVLWQKVTNFNVLQQKRGEYRDEVLSLREILSLNLSVSSAPFPRHYLTLSPFPHSLSISSFSLHFLNKLSRPRLTSAWCTGATSSRWLAGREPWKFNSTNVVSLRNYKRSPLRNLTWIWSKFDLNSRRWRSVRGTIFTATTWAIAPPSMLSTILNSKSKVDEN